MRAKLRTIEISILADSQDKDTNMNTILVSPTSGYGFRKTIMADRDLRRGAGVVSGGGGPNSLPGWLSGIGVCSASKHSSNADVLCPGAEMRGVRGVVSPPRSRHSPVPGSLCASIGSLNAWRGSACSAVRLPVLVVPSSTCICEPASVSQPDRHSPSHRPGHPFEPSRYSTPATQVDTTGCLVQSQRHRTRQ
jgi:hypothetical protein